VNWAKVSGLAFENSFAALFKNIELKQTKPLL
jgi:hypothetical protein